MTSFHEPASKGAERDASAAQAPSHAAVADPHERALVLDRSARGRMRLTGPRAAELLTGMVSNDILALTPGTGAYACALTAKGRIVADLRVYAEHEALLIDAPQRAAPGWREMVRKFVNPRVAPYRDVSAELRHLTVFGAGAGAVVAQATGLAATALHALPPYGSVRTSDQDALVSRSPELQVETFDLFVDPAHADTLVDRLRTAGAGSGSEDAWSVMRVEAGRPEWGLDMDEGTLPQEANMDELGAISYTKGCYVGQEVVARIHFRGHVNRHLRGLRFAATEPAPRGSELFDTGGKAVGDVRSGVASPRFGAIALAMVRREIPVGDELVVRDGQHESRARVTSLPFTA